MIPLVSIAIPAYKATFLREAIQSVLAQSYQNIEVIIVNDNSPENIEAIVGEYADSRIRYYQNTQNVGFNDPSANWNKCLQLAKGEFFSILCDDDVYEKDFVKNMLSLSESYPSVQIFRSRAQIINEKSEIIDFYPSSPNFEECFDYIWHRLNGFRRQTISEFFYRTSYIKEKGGFVPMPKAWGSDDLSFFLFSLENGIASTSTILVNYRASSICISATNSHHTRDKIKAHVIYKEKLNRLLENCHNQIQKKLIIQAYNKFHYEQITIPLMYGKIKDIIWAYKKGYISVVWGLKALILNVLQKFSLK